MTITKRHALFFVASLLPVPVAAAYGAAVQAPVEAPRAGQLKLAADALLRTAYPADGPGAAVIITRGGHTLYAAGRGLADVAGKRPLTPDSVFRIGSITKQFTATAVLRVKSKISFALGTDGVMRFVIKRGAREINGRRRP